MIVNLLPPDVKWGFLNSKGWVFGYKLHMSCSTDKLIVLLSTDVTTANVHDCTMYCTLVESLAGLVARTYQKYI